MNRDMENDKFCDGCACLAFERPVNRYDVHRALCCDPDKTALGVRRVVATAGIAPPRFIHRPAWCRGRQ